MRIRACWMNPHCIAEALSATARSFGTQTVESYDGFHVAHFGMLGQEGAQLLADLAQVMLAQGRVPTAIRAMLLILLPKATEGYRSIVLFPAIYRVLIRSVRPYMDRWQKEKDFPHFSFNAGKSAIKAVWIQAAEA